VDRWLAGRHERLAGGLALPFAVALLEYDLAPQELALDVASGAVDLSLEAQLLEIPERRVVAESEARRLGRLALERIDANRTARRELRGVLGDAESPWLGVSLTARTTRAAAQEAAALVRDGADLVRVVVPTGRELIMRLLDLGRDDEAAPLDADGTPEDELDEAPVGSQRGLGALRGVLDELAAERGAYVRLATAAPALSAPEQAVVATFERIDVVEADPFREILEAGVEPDRALADHAFAHRLYRRGGSIVEVGPGPLIVAPDLARGIPSDPATRAGRALALQLLGVRLALAGGLEPAAVVAGALPDWLLDEPDPASFGLAEVAVRRALFAGHPLAFDAPAPRTADDRGLVEVWSYLVGAALPLAAPSAYVTRPRAVIGLAGLGRVHAATRLVGRAVGEGLEARPLRGRAAEHATATIAAAIATLEALGDRGWGAILGEGPGEDERPRLGAETVVETVDAFDPFDAPDGLAASGRVRRTGPA
jgi:D-Lysine 5,6-aminomutase TIM-barrel domain of alpha subunit